MNDNYISDRRKIKLFNDILDVVGKYEPLIQGKPVVSSIEELFRKYHDVMVQRDLLLDDKRVIINSLKDVLDDWERYRDVGALIEILHRMIEKWGNEIS